MVRVLVTLPSIPKQPLILPDGHVDPVWGRFFYDLWKRTGGANDLIDSITKAVEIEGSCDTAVNVGEAVYVRPDGIFDKADASDISTAKVIGFVSEKSGTTACTVRISGEIETFSGLTSGDYYFLSTTEGAIDNSAPVAAGEVVTGVGKAVSSSKLIVELQNMYTIRS